MLVHVGTGAMSGALWRGPLLGDRVGLAVLIEKCMQERGLSFKHAVNSAIREGLAEGEGRPFRDPHLPNRVRSHYPFG